MLTEFYLEHEVLGILQISEPDGFKDLKLTLERDKNFHGITERFEGSFIFYGDNGVVNGGIDRILEVERDYGPDAKLIFRARVSFDGYTFEDLFEGLLQLFGIIGMPDNKIQVPVIPNDILTKFINRLDTPVNIQDYKSLDGDDVDYFESINLHLTSQKIQKKFIGNISEGQTIYQDDILINEYIQLDFYSNELNEIDKKYDLPIAANPDIPVSLFDINEAGAYNVNFRLEMSTKVYSGGGIPACAGTFTTDPVSSIIELYIQISDETPVLIVGVDVPGLSTVYTFNQDYTFKTGDQIRIYAKLISTSWVGTTSSVGNILIWGDNNTNVTVGVTTFVFTGVFCQVDTPYFSTRNFGIAPSGNHTPSYLHVTGQTVYPESNAFGFLIHDVAGQIIDRYTGQNDLFYSEHLGSDRTLYRQYASDGCGWKYAIAKGLQIRNYSLIEKPFFLSFNQWWKGVNPVLALSLSYEEVNGTNVIRVERLDDAYDQSSVSLNISNVRQISREYDQDVIFKTVKVGYSKWQSEDVSGIDDPQTKHTYATRLQKAGNDLTIESDFIAASLAIETTRRTTRLKSADYKFDNDTFIIAINPIPTHVSPETSPDVNDYKPELNENFSSITNLLNSDTRYNSRITPARNLMRWIRYVSGCLQAYIDSKFKFVSGEGNYDMTSDMINVSDGCDEIKPAISEKQDLPVYDDPLHLSLKYEIVVPLEWEDYVLIRDNRKKAIGISQTTTDHVKFFIDTLEYELVKGVATIKAWPVEFFDIQVIETTSNQNVCFAVPGDCDDAYLTEDGLEFITEDGDCLILN